MSRECQKYLIQTFHGQRTSEVNKYHKWIIAGGKSRRKMDILKGSLP